MKINCNTIEKILFESSLDDINKIEKAEIINHVKGCEKCQSSEQLIKDLSHLMELEMKEKSLLPDPNILVSLKQNFQESNKKDDSIIMLIKRFMLVRIPVYQVVSAVLLFLGLSYFIHNSEKRVDSINISMPMIAEIDSNKILMNFQHPLEFIDLSKRGKSIMEDSVLSSFIRSAM